MTVAGAPIALCPTLKRGGHGTVICTLHYDDKDEHARAFNITVDHADPHIMVSDELLSDTRQYPLVALRLEPPPGAPPPVPWVDWHDHDLSADPWPCQPYLTTPDHRYRCWHNWLLHIDATNQHLVYRISTYNLDLNAWSASWPD